MDLYNIINPSIIAYVAAMAIAIRLKPCRTIRVLSTVKTRAVTELGYTAPSLLG